MPSSFLEIIQLANGEIVLQRADDEGEPLVNIRFSEESRDYIGEAEMDIAKVMIQAGMQAVAHISEEQAKKDSVSDRSFEEADDGGKRVLH